MKSQSRFSNIPSYINQSLNDRLDNFSNKIDEWEAEFRNENKENNCPLKLTMSFQALTRKLEQMMTGIRAAKLESIWLKAEKRYSKTADYLCWSDMEDGQAWLALAIYCATPVEENQFTKAEANEWKDEVIKHTQALLSLLERTPHTFNHVLTGYEKLVKDSIQTVFNESIIERDYGIDVDKFRLWMAFSPLQDASIGDPIGHLNMLSKTVEHCEQEHGFWLDRRYGEEGRRIYFVRSLTNSFIKRTGGPKRGNVQAITNALYEGSISEQQIIELTRDVVGDNDLFEDESWGTFESVAKEWGADRY